MAAFDEHRTPQLDIVEDCVHCGFCLDTCPTYALWAAEADSPRGRIVLIGDALGSAESLSDEMVTHWDRCLGCMACVTACPSGVRYDRLIERVRPQVERHHRRSLRERVQRRHGHMQPAARGRRRHGLKFLVEETFSRGSVREGITSFLARFGSAARVWRLQDGLGFPPAPHVPIPFRRRSLATGQEAPRHGKSRARRRRRGGCRRA